jgi:hypothetical protein
MDVTRITSPSAARMAFLGSGTIAGLVLALPVRTGSVACPPANEGRVNCLVQHAWAPAFVKVTACLLAAYVLHELLMVALPSAVRRMRSGERLARRSHDHGRQAVLTDPVLAAANWGVVPEPRRRLLRRNEPTGPVNVPRPRPDFAPDAQPVRGPAFAAAPAPLAAPAPEAPAPVTAWDRLLAEAVAAEGAAPAPVAEPVAVAAPVTAPPEPPATVDAIRALGPEQRRARTETLGAHLRVIGSDEPRTRRLRGTPDQALAVAAFSDASAAAAHAEDLLVPAVRV